MDRTNKEETSIQQMGVLKSRLWRDGDGWRERLIGRFAPSETVVCPLLFTLFSR